MKRGNALFLHRHITDRWDKPAWNLSARARVIWRIRLSLSNAVRIDKDRKNLPSSLSLSRSPSLKTDVATYRAAYGFSPLSVISLSVSHAWMTREWENVAPK